MRTDLPTSILNSAYSLEPPGLVSLYVMTLKSGPVFRMAPKIETTWQGHVYEVLPCTLTEMQQGADGKSSRPNFTFVNPGGVFTSHIYNRLIDKAELVRFRILRDDLLSDQNYAITETYEISQVLNMAQGTISVQVRDVHDGQSFLLPARAYFPPEFPHVSP